MNLLKLKLNGETLASYTHYLMSLKALCNTTLESFAIYINNNGNNTQTPEAPRTHLFLKKYLSFVDFFSGQLLETHMHIL